jgi:LmbE family N-acetylglucosaminyl deacetylase
MDAIEQRDRSGNLILPDFTVNIASTFETKRAMLAKHRSQSLWLQHQHGMKDYPTQMEEW